MSEKLNSVRKTFFNKKTIKYPPSKHMPFFRFTDALKGNQKTHLCPVCSLILSDQTHYIETLLYEGVNDRSFRKKFTAAGGFCVHHTYELKKQHDGLAIAIMYRPLIQKRFKDPNAHRPDLCTICDYLAGQEAHYRSVIIQYLADQEFITAFQHSAGLCLPHYQGLIEGGFDLPAWFFDFHETAFTSLENRILTYIDGHNESLGPEKPQLTKKEALVYQELLDLLHSYPGRSIKAVKAWKGTG